MPTTSAVIKRTELPQQWPTSLHTPDFWEQLGRTVATFGFLEDTLARAIFAFTATTEYSEEEAVKVLGKWREQLEQALTDTLWPLSEVYGKVVRQHHEANFKNVGDLVADIKAASKVRNALCHGAWMRPDADGKSELRYFDKKDGKFETRIDTAWLRQVQDHVLDLICNVINSVTVMGWEFPGGVRLGQPIWTK